MRNACIFIMLLDCAASGQFAGVPGSPSPTATQSGQITGQIETADGKPLAGAQVAIRVRPTSPTAPVRQFNTSTLSAADGTFAVDDVPPGMYAICPTAGTNLLPPCIWGDEPTLTVSAGQTTAETAFQMAAGTDLYVRVNDPTGITKSAQGTAAGASLVLGVFTPQGRLALIPMTASDANGFDNHLTVPSGATLGLVAYSKTFALADATGVAANAATGLQQTITIGPTATQTTVVINLTGVNAH